MPSYVGCETVWQPTVMLEISSNLSLGRDRWPADGPGNCSGQRGDWRRRTEGCAFVRACGLSAEQRWLLERARDEECAALRPLLSWAFQAYDQALNRLVCEALLWWRHVVA